MQTTAQTCNARAGNRLHKPDCLDAYIDRPGCQPEHWPPMLRAPTIALLALLPAAVATAEDRKQLPDDFVTPTMIVARLANVLEVPLVPQPIVDQLVRWQLGMRDLAYRAAVELAGFAERTGFTIPDVAVLQAQPVAPSKSTWATSAFGWREDPIRRRKKFHRGADIRAKSGTPVMCAGDGVVVLAGRQGGYGNVIYVDHGGGVVTRYAHLRRIEVEKGAAITAGQRIGQVGSTGRTTGPHLHFEVRLDGRAVDPWTVLTIGELARESPAAARVASFALAPELQELAESELDPPKETKRARATGTSRPDRPGRVKRVRPVS